MKTNYSHPKTNDKHALQLAPATEPSLPPPPQLKAGKGKDQLRLTPWTFPPPDAVRNSTLRLDGDDSNSTERSEPEGPGAVAYNRYPDRQHGDDNTIWSPEVSPGPQVYDHEMATAQPVSAVLATDRDSYNAIYQRLAEIQQREANLTLAEVVRGEPSQEDTAEDNMKPRMLKCLYCRIFVGCGIFVVLAIGLVFGIPAGPAGPDNIKIADSPSSAQVQFPSPSPELQTQPPTINDTSFNNGTTASIFFYWEAK